MYHNYCLFWLSATGQSQQGNPKQLTLYDYFGENCGFMEEKGSLKLLKVQLYFNLWWAA